MEQLSFFQRVYKVVLQIPYAKVTSYGAIANYLGSKGSARMVGWAMNASKKHEIPAHRVVNKKGLLTGKHHFQGTSLNAAIVRIRRDSSSRFSDSKPRDSFLGPSTRITSRELN